MNGGNDIRAVVFDMGGVLVELGPLTDILGDDPLTPEEFWPRWLASPTVRAFERGELTPDEFGRRLVLELGLTFDGPELVERFAAWPRGLYPGAAQLVGRVRGRAVVGVLTNTNPLHWETQVDSGQIRDLFDRDYLSFELGLVKPDQEIFQHVVDDLQLEPTQILYLDDNQINVDAAVALGLVAERAVGLDAVVEQLDRFGLS